MSANSMEDIEKQPVEVASVQTAKDSPLASGFLGKLARWGIEINGSAPVPREQRTQPAFNIVSLWLSMSVCLLPIVTGITGTLSFGLSLRDSSLVILFFSIISIPPVAYMSIGGPKTGLRQMVQSRYAFGKYGVCLPVVLNMATLAGFCVIGSVLGGQALAAVSANADFTEARISANAGIIIIALLALIISFFGTKVLHQYERYAWIVITIAVVIATGCGGSKLHLQSDVPAGDVWQVLGFGALIAGFFLPYGGLCSDFFTYVDPDTSSWRIAAYTFTGLFVPSVPLLVLGAAIGGAVPQVESWSAGNDAFSAGGILAAMLQPAGGFGKFVLVLLALSVLGNVAATVYAITVNFQLVVPVFARIPRAFFAIVVTAVVIPVSIKAVTSFFDSLENFLGVIGYWAAAYCAVIIIEHAFIRKAWAAYDPAIFNDGRALPTGIPAIAAGALSFAVVIPGMDEIWYTGPIAEKTGDIGFEMAFVITSVLYPIFRLIEIKLRGGRL